MRIGPENERLPVVSVTAALLGMLLSVAPDGRSEGESLRCSSAP
jgi:hypothetical protein